MKSFERLINRMGNWGAAVAAFFMSGIALLITTSVICRAVHISLPGTFDLVETLVVVAIAFALVYGQLEDRHRRADIAIERLKGRVRSAIESFIGALNLLYWIILLCAGAVMMWHKWQGEETTDVLNVPGVPFRGGWVFALILMVLLLFFKLIHHVSALIRGGEEK
jgi:TRAP-type C4-dicarboxylate transport system permease small subunit